MKERGDTVGGHVFSSNSTHPRNHPTRQRSRHILQYSKEELRRMGWRGETYFSRSQNGRAAPYIDDMDSDSDYSYDDLSGVPEHLLSKSWDDPSIIQTYAQTAGPQSSVSQSSASMPSSYSDSLSLMSGSAAPRPQCVTPPPSSVSANGSHRRNREGKEEDDNCDTINDKDGLVFCGKHRREYCADCAMDFRLMNEYRKAEQRGQVDASGAPDYDAIDLRFDALCAAERSALSAAFLRENPGGGTFELGSEATRHLHVYACSHTIYVYIYTYIHICIMSGAKWTSSGL